MVTPHLVFLANIHHISIDMNKICFLKHCLLLLIQSGLYVIDTKKYSIKFGFVYETKGKYLIVYYDFQEEACMAIRVVSYDKDFKELSNDTYFSEDDVVDYIDELPSLSESPLNKELLSMLNDMISFVKPEQRKVVN